jgi:hypothetical protein
VGEAVCEPSLGGEGEAQGEAEGVPEEESAGEAVREKGGLLEAEGLGGDERDREGVLEAVSDFWGLLEMLGEGMGENDRAGLLVREGDTEGEALGLPAGAVEEGVGEGEREGRALALKDPVPLPLWEARAVREGLVEALPPRTGELDTQAALVTVRPKLVALPRGVAEEVGHAERVASEPREAEVEGEGEGVGFAALAVARGAVGEGERVWAFTECVDRALKETEELENGGAVGVLEVLCEALAAAERDSERVCEEDFVREEVGVGVLLLEGDAEGVRAAEAEWKVLAEGAKAVLVGQGEGVGVPTGRVCEGRAVGVVVGLVEGGMPEGVAEGQAA